jgi:imidazoleglycerol phosphate dehydratase HisB
MLDSDQTEAFLGAAVQPILFKQQIQPSPRRIAEDIAVAAGRVFEALDQDRRGVTRPRKNSSRSPWDDALLCASARA